MKLLQWNIWYKEDAGHILELLKLIQPDIICLQESTIGYPENNGIDVSSFLAKSLDYNCFFCPAQEWQLGGVLKTQGNVILSKYPIVDTSYLYIQQPQDPSLNSSDYTKEGRVYAEVCLDVNGQVLTVGTAHASYTDAFVVTDAKRAELDRLINVFRHKRNRYIFAGDLNVNSDADAIVAIQQHLQNLGPGFEYPTWTTKPFSYRGFEENRLHWRLDYVFGTEDIEVKNTSVIDTEYSDHLPLLLDFNVR